MSHSIMCGACGRRFGPDDHHPCLEKAERAAAERIDAIDAPDAPLEVELFVHPDREDFERPNTPETTPTLPSFTLTDVQAVPLRIYRVSAEHELGKHGFHLVLCQPCWRRLHYTLTLSYVAPLENHNDPDWAPNHERSVGLDGCDCCGLPPQHKERQRKGPSELFYALFSGPKDVNFGIY